MSQSLLESLPYELYGDIIACMGAIPLSLNPGKAIHLLFAPPSNYDERTLSLRALSQTSHRLRLLLWHRLWERVDVHCDRVYVAEKDRWRSSHDALKAAALLLRNLRDSQGVCSIIRIVSTQIPIGTGAAFFVRELVDTLDLLPQLQVLQILDCGRLDQLEPGPIFSGRTFTQRVQTLSVPSNGHIFLRYFPNVTRVVYLRSDEASVETVRALASCPSLHHLEGDLSWPQLLSLEPDIMTELSQVASQLTSLAIPLQVGLDWQLVAAAIPTLVELRHLQSLTITCCETWRPQRLKWDNRHEIAASLVDVQYGNAVEAARRVMELRREVPLSTPRRLITRLAASSYTTLDPNYSTGNVLYEAVTTWFGGTEREVRHI